MIDCHDLLVQVRIKSIVILVQVSAIATSYHSKLWRVLKETITETAGLFGAVPQVPDTP